MNPPVYLGPPCKVDPSLHASGDTGQTLRYVSNNHCVECAKLDSKKKHKKGTKAERAAYMRNWRALNGRYGRGVTRRKVRQTEHEKIDPAPLKKRYLGDTLPKGKAVHRDLEDLIWMNRGTRY
jgi:hypothetical protein